MREIYITYQYNHEMVDNTKCETPRYSTHKKLSLVKMYYQIMISLLITITLINKFDIFNIVVYRL